MVGSPPVGAGLASVVADIVEIAAFRGRVSELVALGAARGLELPPLGRITLTSNRLVLCVRPERWLLLTPRASAGASAALWQGACAPIATAVDLSSGLAALYLTGSEVRAVLSRSCRLDLDPQVFPAGAAAATLMAQVSVLLAALPAGWLLLTPSSTARHVREWFAATARPFGFQLREDATVAVLSGESS
jgi:sarcosine oxidase subunit gamma